MAHFRLYCGSLLLAVSTSLAEFSSSDSANLSSILQQVGSFRGDFDNHALVVDGIRTRLIQVHDEVLDSRLDLDSIDNTLLDVSSDLEALSTMLAPLPDDVSDIYDQVYHISQCMDDFKFAYTRRYSDNRSEYAILSHDYRNDDIYDRLGFFASGLSNRVDSTISAINNLTNYLCTIPQNVATFTNRYSQLYPQAWRLADFDNNTLSTFFKFYYGYQPSSSEMASFRATVGRLSVYDLAEQYVSLAPKSALSGNPYYAYVNMSSALQQIGVNATTRDYISYLGDIRYQLYGTKDLTTITHGISNTISRILITQIGISNIVANITNGLYDVTTGGFLDRDTGSSSGYSVGSVVKSGVGSVMSSSFFTDTVKTNVVGSVWSNDVTRIPDNAYSRQLDQLQDSDPTGFTELSDVLNQINTASGAIDDVGNFLDADHSDNFVLPLSMSLSGVGNVDFSLILENQSSRTRPIVEIICYFLQIAIFIFFFRLGWSHVVSVVNFHNASDPF